MRCWFLMAPAGTVLALVPSRTMLPLSPCRPTRRNSTWSSGSGWICASASCRCGSLPATAPTTAPLSTLAARPGTGLSPIQAAFSLCGQPWLQPAVAPEGQFIGSAVLDDSYAEAASPETALGQGGKEVLDRVQPSTLRSIRLQSRPDL